MSRISWFFQSSLFRFLLVGGGMAVVYSASAAVLTRILPLPPALIAVAVWLACIPPAFVLQRRFTFGDRAAHRHALALYALTQGAGMIIVSLAGWLFATRVVALDLGLYLGASVLSAMVSYGMSRMVIFAGPAPKGGA